MPEDETSTAQAEIEEQAEESETEWQLTQAEFQALTERQSRIEESLNQLNSRLAQPETPPVTAVAVASPEPEAVAEPEALTVSEPPAEPEGQKRKSRKRSLRWKKRKAS